MAGFVLKGHYGSSVETAALVDRKVADLKVLGGLLLNQFVGGLNPLCPISTKGPRGFQLRVPPRSERSDETIDLVY
jgi:hypothetical protein